MNLLNLLNDYFLPGSVSGIRRASFLLKSVLVMGGSMVQFGMVVIFLLVLF